jgi:hypothetical protein
MSSHGRENERLNNHIRNLENQLENVSLEASLRLREARDLQEASARIRDQQERIRASQPKAGEESAKTNEK